MARLVNDEGEPAEDRPVLVVVQRTDGYERKIGEQYRSPAPAAPSAPLERIAPSFGRAQFGIAVMNVSERRRRTTMLNAWNTSGSMSEPTRSARYSSVVFGASGS